MNIKLELEYKTILRNSSRRIQEAMEIAVNKEKEK
jgi:hypothetical protein